ncbi:MAG: type II toxin-antitoxin system VapC family toxin [Actinomycetota bacterium]
MRLLLDTHVLLWWLQDDPLAVEAAAVMADPTNEISVSAASIWEISIKRQLGKIDIPDDLVDQCRKEGFSLLSMDARHAERAGSLPLHHTDPFDRMLIAQAELDTLLLVTRDKRLAAYGVQLLPA